METKSESCHLSLNMLWDHFLDLTCLQAFPSNYLVGSANGFDRPFKHLSTMFRHKLREVKGRCFSHNNLTTYSSRPLCLHPQSSEQSNCLEQDSLYWVAQYKWSCLIAFFLALIKPLCKYVWGKDSFVLTCSASTLSSVWKMQTAVRCCKHYVACAFCWSF